MESTFLHNNFVCQCSSVAVFDAHPSKPHHYFRLQTLVVQKRRSNVTIKRTETRLYSETSQFMKSFEKIPKRKCLLIKRQCKSGCCVKSVERSFHYCSKSVAVEVDETIVVRIYGTFLQEKKEIFDKWFRRFDCFINIPSDFQTVRNMRRYRAGVSGVKCILIACFPFVESGCPKTWLQSSRFGIR